MTTPTQSDLQKLQALLLGRHQSELEAVRQRLEDPDRRADDIASVLVQALKKAPDPERLSRVISEPTTEAIRVSIRRDSERVAGILYPAVLPAIRKSIEQAMQGFLESIDLLLKQQFSAASLKWRFEALRTGVPFHEIMLRHMLRYQVEQVFLIHRHSGLLIAHVSSSETINKDSDAVSAMLSAIESFVRESFSKDKEDQLSRVTVGDRVVYLEHGPNALLASVVRGVATPAYRRKLKELSEDIHASYSRQLETFSGTTDDVPAIDNLLKRALGREFQFQEPKPKGNNRKKLKRLIGISALAGGLLLGYLGWLHFQKGRLDKLLAALADQPGIVTSQTVKREGEWVIHALKDPDAPAPSDLAASYGLSGKVNFQLEPYLSLAPEIINRRARRALNIPASVQSEVKNSTLILSGKAPLEWLLSLGAIKDGMPTGLTAVDTSRLQLDIDEFRDMLDAKLKSLENISLVQNDAGIIELDVSRSLAEKERTILKQLKNALAPQLIIRLAGHQP